MSKQITAVEWLVDELLSGRVLLPHLIKQAKEMEKQHNANLLEWLRLNAVEVPDGWRYGGVEYTDSELIELYYNETFKQ
jgi:hypothetical protein